MQKQIKMETIINQLREVISTELVPYLLSKLTIAVESEQEAASLLSDAIANSNVASVKPAAKSAAVKSVKPKVTEVAAVSDGLENDYSKMTIAKLKDLCKERHLTISGTKATLVLRLVDNDKNIAGSDLPDGGSDQVVIKKARKAPKSKEFIDEEDEEDKPKKRMVKPKADKPAKPKVVEKYVPTDIVTEQDQYGNVVNVETGFVFGDDDEVKGKVDEEGNVMPLTKDDIEKCKEMSLKYVVEYIQDTDSEDDLEA